MKVVEAADSVLPGVGVDIVAACGSLTCSMAKPETIPPQVSAYVKVPGEVGVIVDEPLYAPSESEPAWSPDQVPAPDALFCTNA